MKIKIENDILLFIIIRSIFLLFFFKLSILEITLACIISSLLIFILNKMSLPKKLLFKVIMIIFLFITAIKTLNLITAFIEYNILKDYSIIVISITFLILCFLLAYRGYHSYIKSIELSFYIIIFLLLFSLCLIIPNISLDNFNNQLLSELTINFPMIYFIISIILFYLSINYLNNYKLNYKVFFLTFISLIITKIITIGILGETLLNIYYYPFINIFKRIKYLDFIERMEGILSFTALFGFYFLLAGILLIIKFLLIDIFKIKKDKVCNITLSIVTIMILIIALIS